MRAAMGLPSRVAGAKVSFLAASTAALSKAAPPETVTLASVTAPWTSIVSASTTRADSAVAFLSSGYSGMITLVARGGTRPDGAGCGSSARAKDTVERDTATMIDATVRGRRERFRMGPRAPLSTSRANAFGSSATEGTRAILMSRHVGSVRRVSATDGHARTAVVRALSGKTSTRRGRPRNVLHFPLENVETGNRHGQCFR